MSSEIVDLDAVVGPPKKVRLGGTVYVLPGDIPVELYLALNQAAQAEEAGDGDQVEILYEQLLDLFRIHQPDLETLPLSMTQLVQAIPTIYGGADTDEGKEPPKRTRASRGTASTRQRASRKQSPS